MARGIWCREQQWNPCLQTCQMPDRGPLANMCTWEVCSLFISFGSYFETAMCLQVATIPRADFHQNWNTSALQQPLDVASGFAPVWASRGWWAPCCRGLFLWVLWLWFTRSLCLSCFHTRLPFRGSSTTTEEFVTHRSRKQVLSSPEKCLLWP